MTHDRYLYDSVAQYILDNNGIELSRRNELKELDNAVFNARHSRFEPELDPFENWVFGARHMASFIYYTGVIANLTIKRTIQKLSHKKQEFSESTDPYDSYTETVILDDGTQKKIPINQLRLAEIHDRQDKKNAAILDEKGKNKYKNQILARIRYVHESFSDAAKKGETLKGLTYPEELIIRTPALDARQEQLSTQWKEDMDNGIDYYPEPDVYASQRGGYLNHTAYFGNMDLPGELRQKIKFNERIEMHSILSGFFKGTKKKQKEGLPIFRVIGEDKLYISHPNGTMGHHACSKCANPILDSAYYELLISEDETVEIDGVIEAVKKHSSHEQILAAYAKAQLDPHFKSEKETRVKGITRMYLHPLCAHNANQEALFQNHRPGNVSQLLSNIGKDSSLEVTDDRDLKAIYEKTQIDDGYIKRLFAIFSPSNWKSALAARQLNKRWKKTYQALPE
jgi:hypothetical protein